MSHIPGGRLPLLSARPAVTRATLNRAMLPILLLVEQRHDGCEQFACGCDLNPGPTAPESSTLTTRLPSHPRKIVDVSKQVSKQINQLLLIKRERCMRNGASETEHAM